MRVPCPGGPGGGGGSRCFALLQVGGAQRRVRDPMLLGGRDAGGHGLEHFQPNVGAIQTVALCELCDLAVEPVGCPSWKKERTPRWRFQKNECHVLGVQLLVCMS